MPLKDGAFREIISTELIVITFGLIGGLLLALATDRLFIIPGILILLPGFLEMRGAIGGSMSARLSSGLLLGVLTPRWTKNRILLGNVVATVVLSIVVAVFLGALASLASWLLFGTVGFQIIAVAFIASVIANIIHVPFVVGLVFRLYRQGHDPNNIMGPYVATAGDIISIVSLLIAIAVV